MFRKSTIIGALVAVLTAVAVPAAAQPDASQLQQRLNGVTSRSGSLRGSIAADSRAIGADEGRISVLEARLSTLQSTLDIEDRLLSGLQGQLAQARGTLSAVRSAYASDRVALAAQLVGQYESPPPTLANVLFAARGFSDLLERVNELRTIARQNAQVTVAVRRQRGAVTRQVAQLSALEARQQRITIAALAQRNEIAQVKLAVANDQLNHARARRAKSAVLAHLSSQASQLQSQLNAITVEQNAAAHAPGATYLPPGAGYSGGGFVAHGGLSGFFPAPGTNYSVGSEPEIAARLDALGKALGLHLVGISGYRSPEHSLEVGGFANDPHTRGEASDTPGIEGVPESVLERFGLERPFPGAHEADHIQLLGSPL